MIFKLDAPTPPSNRLREAGESLRNFIVLRKVYLKTKLHFDQFNIGKKYL